MMTRRGPELVEGPFASGARPITNKSDGAMAIQSLAGAALAISPGDGIGPATDAAMGRTSDAAAVAASNRCFMPDVCHAQSACESPAERLGRPFQSKMRSGGRVVEGARLESEYRSKAYRGFESHPLRHGPLRRGPQKSNEIDVFPLKSNA